MAEKMTIWGIGPKFALLSTLYFILVYGIHHLFYPLFVIEAIPHVLLVAGGIVLIASGLPVWIMAARTIVKGFSKDTLVTDGVYAICRHPLYGNGIFLTFPGILMFFRSWILLTVPVFMYFAFRALISREENYLKERFGESYLEYRERVNMAFPKVWKIFRPSGSPRTKEV